MSICRPIPDWESLQANRGPLLTLILLHSQAETTVRSTRHDKPIKQCITRPYQQEQVSDGETADHLNQICHKLVPKNQPNQVFVKLVFPRVGQSQWKFVLSK